MALSSVPAGRPQALPVRRETFEKLAIGERLGSPVIHDDDIQAAERGLMCAKRLAYYPFQPVSCYRQAAIFPGNGEA